MKSSADTRPPVWAPSRWIVPVVVARSIGSKRVRAAGPEHRLDRDAREVVGVERHVDDRPDLVVVDALGDGHRERREDPGVGQPADRGVLDRPQVLAAVPAVRGLAEAVELEVDLDPVAQLGELAQERVVARDPDPVGVEDDAGDVALGGGADEVEDPRVDRRLAAGQHQRVDLAALARDRGVQRAHDGGLRRVPPDARGAARRSRWGTRGCRSR